MGINNKLTVNSTGVQQDWCMVEYPELGIGNKTKHTGQTYLIMNDSILFGHLQHQSYKYKSAFLTSVMDMTEYSPKGWFCYYMILKKTVTINHVWLFPHYY